MTVLARHMKSWLYVLVMSRTRCLNVSKLFARSRRKVWSLSNCNQTRTQNHLVRKRTLNHLAKLAKWWSYVLSTYLYGAFDSMFLSCHVRFSEWIHTLWLPECQGTPRSKQKFSKHFLENLLKNTSNGVL